MTASIWTAYAERRPTKEDADAEGRIYWRLDRTICHTPWDNMGSTDHPPPVWEDE